MKKIHIHNIEVKRSRENICNMQKKFKIRRDAGLNTLVTRRSEEERRRMKDRLRNGFTQCLTQAPEERKNVETDVRNQLRIRRTRNQLNTKILIHHFKPYHFLHRFDISTIFSSPRAINFSRSF